MNRLYKSLLQLAQFAGTLLLLPFLVAVCVVSFAKLCPTEDCASWFEWPHRRHCPHCGAGLNWWWRGLAMDPGKG